MEMAGRRGLMVANDGMEPTFSSGGRTSFVDLAFYPETGTLAVRDWRVLTDETLSDHRYLSYRIERGENGHQREEGSR